MRAAVLTAYGGPEGLILQDVARPEPNDGEVLVRVRATSVTRGDTEIRTFDIPWLFGIPKRLWLGLFRPKNDLVLGWKGSIGSYAVQLAKRFGAHVTGICPPQSVELVLRLGADEVIDYTVRDFAATNERCDLMLDVVGATPIARCLSVLHDNGRYVRGSISSGLSRAASSRRLWMLSTRSRTLRTRTTTSRRDTSRATSSSSCDALGHRPLSSSSSTTGACARGRKGSRAHAGDLGVLRMEVGKLLVVASDERVGPRGAWGHLLAAGEPREVQEVLGPAGRTLVSNEVSF